jgi:mannose-6-phosphate isomerase-like protein (cupin superfamily)
MKRSALLVWTGGLVLAAAAVGAERVEAPVVRFDEVVKANRIDPERGAVLTEVARGEQASVNVWQMTKGLPLHLHRNHEEVIFVKSGRAEVRLGERTLTMEAGDLVLIPKNMPHSARALGEEPFRGISVFAPAFDGKDRVMVDPGTRP